MFVCLFLPSIKFCDRGAAVPPLILPPAWPPYIAALLIALAALAGPLQARTSARWLSRFTSVVVVACDVLFVHARIEHDLDWDVFAGAMVVSAIVLWIAWRVHRAGTELATTLLAWLLAAAIALCGLGLALGRQAVWGGQVMAIGACALLVGTSWWVVEAMWVPRRRRARV